MAPLDLVILANLVLAVVLTFLNVFPPIVSASAAFTLVFLHGPFDLTETYPYPVTAFHVVTVAIIVLMGQRFAGRITPHSFSAFLIYLAVTVLGFAIWVSLKDTYVNSSEAYGIDYLLGIIFMGALPALVLFFIERFVIKTHTDDE